MVEPGEREKAIEESLNRMIEWVRAALNCAAWNWDGDQRAAAEFEVAQAQAAMARTPSATSEGSEQLTKARSGTWGGVFNRHLRHGEDHGSAAYAADQWEKRQNRDRWKNCCDTHCNRAGECRRPSDCCASGRIARERRLALFRAKEGKDG